jgi:hypothetical protein
MLAKICKEVPFGYSKSVDKVRQTLEEEKNQEIVQYFTENVEKNKRYLNAELEEPIVEDIKVPEDPIKELEKLEKTVSIRFANFSQLVK